jgi:DNA-binding MarR family transcriptional regulator
MIERAGQRALTPAQRKNLIDELAVMVALLRLRGTASPIHIRDIAKRVEIDQKRAAFLLKSLIHRDFIDPIEIDFGNGSQRGKPRWLRHIFHKAPQR